MSEPNKSLLETVFEILPPGAIAFIGYVLVLNGIMGAWVMSMIAGQ